MDMYEHFLAWLEAHVPADERESVGRQIMALLCEHPELADGSRSWPELRAMCDLTAEPSQRDVIKQEPRRSNDHDPT